MINRNKLIFLVFTLFLSCINNEKEEKKELEGNLFRKTKNKVEITDHFQVMLRFKALEDDHFQLYYTQDYILNYTEDESIIKKFSGKDEYQDIIFDLPKEIFPVKYRLDLGSNDKQGIINIESLIIRYKKNEIFIPEKLIAIYLTPNKCIKYDSTQNKFELKNTQIDNIKIYDPYFTSSPELVRLLLDL